MFELVNRITVVLVKVLMWLGALAVLGLMINVVADVSMRFLFNRPMPGTIEYVSFWWMVPMGFFGFVVAQRTKEHIDVPLIFDRLGARSRLLIAVAGNVLTAVFLCALVFFGYRSAVAQTRAGEVTGATQVAIWPVRWIVPIALVVFVVQLILDTVAVLHGRPDEASGGVVPEDVLPEDVLHRREES